MDDFGSKYDEEDKFVYRKMVFTLKYAIFLTNLDSMSFESKITENSLDNMTLSCATKQVLIKRENNII